MKRVSTILGLIGVVALALLVAGGGFAAGQQNPIVPPTPTPTPPKGWPVGMPYPLTQEMINGALSRVAPSAPTGSYTSTIKITVGGAVSVTCEGAVRGQQYLPDFIDAQSAKDACATLASEAIAAGKEVELAKLVPAPITSSVKTDVNGDCKFTGDPALASGCFDFTRDAMANLHPSLPMPGEAPAQEPEPLRIYTTFGRYLYEVSAYYGKHVLSFKRYLSDGTVLANDLYINDAIGKFDKIDITEDELMVVYEIPDMGGTVYRKWSLEELFP